MEVEEEMEAEEEMEVEEEMEAEEEMEVQRLTNFDQILLHVLCRRNRHCHQ